MSGHLDLLGFKVRDVVTDFEGVVVSISFDISGCIQGLVMGHFNESKGEPFSRWFDTKRLIKMRLEPVMKLPDFVEVPGGQELPPYSVQPV